MAAGPSRDDRRIILHFDYDCFYASVFEVEQPALKLLPLAVQQKQIVVTCNYEARRRGLRKLQLIKEAKQICPEVVIVLGEDLTKFRDASKELYLFLRAFVWGERVEKLGFDEVFLDVTEMIDYNVALLNPNDLEHSFFHLDRREPTIGFKFDATRFHGPTYPIGSSKAEPMRPIGVVDPGVPQLETRLLVASHLAGYIRGQLESEKGYTATVGISTSKLLAKVVGSVHKPNSQTTLLPPYTAVEQSVESNVLNFFDCREIRAIPGIGSKSSRKLTSHIAGISGPVEAEDKVTVRDVRLFPGMGPVLLDKILGGPGAPRDVGVRVWGLIHGVDSTEVIQARDLPTQISIEDSYGRLDNFEHVRREMVNLAASLIRRMRTDLTEKNPDANINTETRPREISGFRGGPKLRWVARPRTLRLSTQPRPPPSSDGAQSHYPGRISHSAPLPQYIFNLDENMDALAERLVQESLTAMFRKLHRERSGWNLRVLNLAVTNMVEVAGDRKNTSGRDIGKMFQQQETPRWDTIISIPKPDGISTEPGRLDLMPKGPPEATWEESDGDEEDMSCVPCITCGALIPQFALVAHEVYHSTQRK